LGPILRWVLFVLVVVLAALQYRLWVGEGSLGEITVLRREIREQQVELERLRERNRALQAEVEDLKRGLGAIEERARSEMGMVREGEVFYQIIEPEGAAR
jgi:cell division protein FtsB